MIPSTPPAIVQIDNPGRPTLVATMRLERARIDDTNGSLRNDASLALFVEFANAPAVPGPIVIDWGDGTAGEGLIFQDGSTQQIHVTYPGGKTETCVGSETLGLEHAFQTRTQQHDVVTAAVAGRVIASARVSTGPDARGYKDGPHVNPGWHPDGNGADA